MQRLDTPRAALPLLPQSVVRVKLGRNRAYRRWCLVYAPNATAMQKCWRGLMGRRYAERVRFLRDTKAAMDMQRVSRGFMSRQRVRLLRALAWMQVNLWRMRSTLHMQRVGRGFIGRCRARRRLGYAVRIMVWWRAVFQRYLRAAILAQATARGWLVRWRRKVRAATLIQCLARGVAARERVRKIREEMEEKER